MKNILVLNGPNLNLLGSRETNFYGKDTLDKINVKLIKAGKAAKLKVKTLQSNAEHVLIDHVQRCPAEKIHFIILNPAAFTHTSIALRDALLSVNIPFIEVHISNIHRREAFRHHSYFSDIAVGTITGLGTAGYFLALQYAQDYLTTQIESKE